jgi:hypothetical protein
MMPAINRLALQSLSAFLSAVQQIDMDDKLVASQAMELSDGHLLEWHRAYEVVGYVETSQSCVFTSSTELDASKCVLQLFHSQTAHTMLRSTNTRHQLRKGQYAPAVQRQDMIRDVGNLSSSYHAPQVRAQTTPHTHQTRSAGVAPPPAIACAPPAPVRSPDRKLPCSDAAANGWARLRVAPGQCNTQPFVHVSQQYYYCDT